MNTYRNTTMEYENSFQIDYRRDPDGGEQSRSRRSPTQRSARRGRSADASRDGIHRRRNKRWSW